MARHRHRTIREVLVLAAGLCMAAASHARLPDTLAGTDVTEGTHERIEALDTLVGQWSLTSRELTAEGDALEARGVRTCRWALGGTAIRCDDRYESFGNVNGRPRPVTVEDSLFYLSFNGQTGMYEYTYYSPALSELRTVPASFDARRGVLRGSAWVTSGEGDALLATNVSHIRGPDRIEETFSVTAVEDDRQVELLEIELTRRTHRHSPIMHF